MDSYLLPALRHRRNGRGTDRPKTNAPACEDSPSALSVSLAVGYVAAEVRAVPTAFAPLPRVPVDPVVSQISSHPIISVLGDLNTLDAAAADTFTWFRWPGSKVRTGVRVCV